jgi:translocator protein
MTEQASRVDLFRAVLVAAATVGVIIFNFLAATGRLNGVDTGAISDKYPTPITPAGYAFSIWTLIYIGLIAFSIWQLIPSNRARFANIRSFYILSCALNCGWLYMWHSDQIAVCSLLLLILAISLFFINLYLKRTEGLGDYWFVKAPFGIYFGWVTAAALVNFAILMVYWQVSMSETAWMILSVVLILLAAAFGIFFRIRFNSYLYPLAIAWAVAAIGVGQSGNTAVVVASAIALVACLIASLSFVLGMPSTENPRESVGS